MLKFGDSKLRIKSAIGSEALLKIDNPTERNVMFTVHASIPNCLKICGQNALRHWIGPNETMYLVVQSLDRLKNRGDAFYLRFDVFAQKKNYKIPIEVYDIENDREETSEAINTPNNGLNCPICFEDFDSEERVPRLLKECGDTFCEMCLKTILGDEKYVNCPLDRRRTDAENGIEGFRKNFALLSLLDQGKMSKNEEKGPEKIGKEINQKKEEQEVEILIEEKETVESKKTELVCPNHPKENGRFLCTNPKCPIENKLMCGFCMAENGKHEGHSYISSKNFLEKVARCVSEFEIVKQKHIDLQSELDRVNKRIEDKSHDYTKKGMEIEQFCLTQSALIREKSSKLRDMIIEKFNEKRKKIDEQLSDLKEDCNRFQIVQKEISGLLRKEIVDKEDMKKLDEIMDKVPELLVLTPENDDSTDNFYEKTKCEFHKEECVMFYCTSAECSVKSKLMCVECMCEEGKHEGHSYGSLKKLNEKRGKLKKINQKLKGMEEKKRQEFKKLELVKSEIERSQLKEINEQHKETEKESKKMEKMKEEAMKELKKEQEEDIKAIKKQLEKLESLLIENSKLKAKLENVFNSSETDKKLIELVNGLEFSKQGVRIGN